MASNTTISTKPAPESAPGTNPNATGAETPVALNPQNITINMVTPQSGAPTEGLSEIEAGGRFALQEPDPSKPGKFTTRLVDAQGQTIQ